MSELRNVKILLVPTKEQEKMLFTSAYYARKMYNQALEWNIDYYNSDGKCYSRFDLIKMLPEFKRANPEYLQVNNFILKEAVTNLREALNNMKKTGAGFPKFKNCKCRKSFGVRNDHRDGKNSHLKLKSNLTNIPSIGWIKSKHCHYLTRNLSDEQLLYTKFHNAHVVYDNKYWFLVVGIDVNLTPENNTDEVVGIDLGIKSTIYTSNGVSEPNINRSRQIEILKRRMKILQRRVSRKYELNKDGNKFIKTNNIRKLEYQIRILYRKLTSVRESNLHKILNKVVSKLPKRIVIEDLNVKGMMKNRCLSKAIAEQQFYRIRQLLTEKCVNYTIELRVVPRFFPSSKTCSRCGSIKRDLTLSDRTYTCSSCGLVIDRDYNAALNLKNYKF